MRTYFDFRLKGSQVFLYVLIGWAITVALVAITSGPSILALLSGSIPGTEEKLLDSAYLWSGLGSLAVGFLQILINYGVVFFIVRATLEGLSLGDDRFTTQYDLGSYAWLVVKGAFFSMITLGMYMPWFVVRVMRYFAQNTHFRSNTFDFKGKGMTLFGIVVITMVLPIFLMIVALAAMGLTFYAVGDGPSMGVLWGLLIVFAFLFMMSLYVALLIRWYIDFSYASKRITSDMKTITATFFIMGQMLLTIITFGLYGPMYMLRVYRYCAGHVLLGGDIVEDRFGFTLNVWKDYFFLLGQGLLCIITIGIYWPWAYAKVARRIFTHTYVETVEEQRIPMPEE